METWLAFSTAKVNRPATQRRVKKALDLARDFIRMGFHPGIEARTTAGWHTTPSTVTNKFRSSTEDAAVRNATIEQERREYVERILAAVNRLSSRERELIWTRWFDGEDRTDIEAYIMLNMTHSSYYRTRSSAFRKLAGGLGMEVYHEEESPA
ncbi:transcriptional regulator [Brevibacillus borstelensis]|uniref:ArpU family phage packaging/lysis transcriptional regulator n=1 Tax=Brevibacillus borstelensis TaxID=45462 RepID=UPI00148FE43C|nr:ArpU family phage packaging/lysis transcriptional regulator [Brevibacillus borstelensis]NOU57036.1 transcriptional regulator [Brevibacillus borstelensis]